MACIKPRLGWFRRLELYYTQCFEYGAPEPVSAGSAGILPAQGSRAGETPALPEGCRPILIRRSNARAMNA